MQKIKRKSGGGDTNSPKKRKEQSYVEKNTDDNVEKQSKKLNDKKIMKKNDVKVDSLSKVKGKKNTEISKPKVIVKGKSKPNQFKGNGNLKDKKAVITKGKDFKGQGGKFSKDKTPTEKPVWSEMKKEKKELRIIRRKAKASTEVFELSHKAKMLSAQIQKKKVLKDFRDSACEELHALLKGQYKNIALTHDLSRVIQVLLKNSGENIRIEIAEELLELMVAMAQSKYAHHAVKRILKYGTEYIRHEVISKFLGHIVSLATHTVSAPVLDYAYGEFATQKEKLYMQQEFYGDIYKNSKDNTVKTLSDTYKNSPEMKTAVLSSCKANIQKILDKNLHDGELLHSVLFNYMEECTPEDRAELISTLSPLIVPLSNSLPGVNAASTCVWQGTNKDKKAILKVVKEHVIPLSTHKTGYRLLLAIFSSVDDTVLVKKTIIATIADNLKDIAKDHWGKMTLHWLIKPNDTAAFHPNLIQFLKDGAKSGTSKKDSEIRVTELREAILPAINTHIQSDPNFWLSDPTTTLLTSTILSIESKQSMLDELAKAICRPDWLIKKDDKDILAIEDAGMHMCLKKMAALDKERSYCSLGEAVSECLDDETLQVWLPTNRGCFFLLKLIESNEETISKKLIKKIKPYVDILKSQTSPGAKLLLQNVDRK